MPIIDVSIEQDKCTSCGLCPEIAGRYFFVGEDGFAYVKPSVVDDPEEPTLRGPDEGVEVADGDEEAVYEAAEECPGECIYPAPISELVLVAPVE